MVNANFTGSTRWSIGRSFSVSCSWRLIVCVETTAFFLCATAKRIAGTRYASDLPTPVPASTTRCSPVVSACATATAICCCCGRYSKLLALESGPDGEKNSSTCFTRSMLLAGSSVARLIIGSTTARSVLAPTRVSSGFARPPLHDLLRALVLHNHVLGQDAAPVGARINHRVTPDDTAGVEHGVAADLGVVAYERAELAQAGVEGFAGAIDGHVAGE